MSCDIEQDTSIIQYTSHMEWPMYNNCTQLTIIQCSFSAIYKKYTHLTTVLMQEQIIKWKTLTKNTPHRQNSSKISLKKSQKQTKLILQYCTLFRFGSDISILKKGMWFKKRFHISLTFFICAFDERVFSTKYSPYFNFIYHRGQSREGDLKCWHESLNVYWLY